MPACSLLFVWQTVKKLGETGLKDAWANAQRDDGPVPDDTALRALGEGEHIVIESKTFSLLAKVTKPRSSFDKKLFVEVAAKKFKVRKEEIEALIESCSTLGQPVLEKRLVEV